MISLGLNDCRNWTGQEPQSTCWLLWVEGGGVGDGGLWGRGQIVTELEAVHNGCLVMLRRQTVLGLGACPGPGRQGGRWDEMCLLSMCLCVHKSILGGQPLGARSQMSPATHWPQLRTM